MVITLAIRTPLTKAGKGGLKDTPLDGLLYKTLCQVVTRSRLDPQVVEDICVGNVNDSRAAYYVRAASLAAGYAPVLTHPVDIARRASLLTIADV